MQAAEQAAAPALAPASRPAAGPLARLARRIERYELALVAVLSLAIVLPGLWSFQLVDPWETHYAEVGRTILENEDWVHLKKEGKLFDSKPVLTFWLMATSMRAMGIADDGGYSGEMVSSDLVVFALRLPFALFGALGLVLMWWMLARLVSRRVAWLALLVLSTTPFYLLVARQAITDMPMVATLIGALACFAMAVSERGDEPLRPIWRRVNAHHLWLAAVGVFVVGWGIYYILYFSAHPQLARGLRVPAPGLLLGGGSIAGFAGLVAWSLLRAPARRSAVYYGWAFALLGVSVLAKGPVGIGIALASAGLWLILSGRWRVLLAWEDLLRGLAAAALVAVPWHVGIYFKAGRPWVKYYFGYHWRSRVSSGAHGDRGTFDYFSSVLGVGTWPWGVLIPAALAAVLVGAFRGARSGARGGARGDEVRLLVGIWAIVAVALFCYSTTKFHHYILPAVPALAILVAFWLDEVLAGRGGRVALAALLGLGLSLLVTRDLIGEQKQIIELFVYRYDRPWPSGKPWLVDVSGPLLLFGALAAASLALFAMPWRRARPLGVAALGATALGFALWAANGYMAEAAPHWGQRELHRTYYAKRQIHGVEIRYWSLRDLADQWEGAGDEYHVESVLPEGFRVGLPMTIRLLVPGAGVPGDAVELRGQVSRVGEDEFWIATTAAERARLKDLIARGRRPGVKPGRAPWSQVDADRLIAWQLNWHGENFWSSGEIYGETKDTRTVFINTDNKAFLEYVGDERRHGRRFFVITEAQRANNLKNVLPTQRAKETVEIIDTSCNKFTLLTFVL
ncbi:MAG TPA: glycosyltransferase family 39 protein [Kofleriaceae bacterium]|nr:glycosyltransferase family 39 protein [Kofleriaceae bacterium]